VSILLPSFRRSLILLNQAHISGESAVRDPFGGCPWSSLFQHTINLLEGETLGLGNEDECIDQAQGAEGAPNEEDARTEIGFMWICADHIGGDDCDDAVPEPVGSGGEGDTTGSDGQREDFANEHPGAWTPSGGKEEDIEANECDLASYGRSVVRLSYSTGSDTDDTNDELADHHTRGTPDHDCTTTPFLNDIEGDRSGADVDKGRDQTDEEGVRDCAELLEKGGAKVEDKVNASPLLHHLKGNAKEGSAEVGRWVAETAGKASIPGAKVAGLRNDRQLILVVGDDFGQFLLDVLRSFWLTTELGQDVDCLVEVSLPDIVTRRLGEQEETGSKNDSPQHLEAHWDTVGAGIESVLGAIVDA